MLERNEIDFVVTVTKVSEGWDVPTLRCAIPFAPILSPAKYLQ
jgi:superfamily II DNA or RNA helicase